MLIGSNGEEDHFLQLFSAIKHVLGLVGVSYLIMQYSPTKYVHKHVFYYNQIFLRDKCCLGLSLLLQWAIWSSYIGSDGTFLRAIISTSLDRSWFAFVRAVLHKICTNTCLFIEKVTTMAFSLHDGKVKKVEELTPIQKREALR